MKAVLFAILGYLLGALILFGVISFTYLNMDVLSWSEGQRFTLVWVPLIGATVGFFAGIKP